MPICTFFVIKWFLGDHVEGFGLILAGFRQASHVVLVYVMLNVFTASKGSLLYYILFVITAAGVVARGGPIKYPRTSSIVHFIFFFPSFEQLDYSEYSKHMFRDIF